METMLVKGRAYVIRRLLGHGKGGYSYLAEGDEGAVVIKQIHHEPCDYYTFGDKLASERADYARLTAAGIRVPRMLDVDAAQERIVKEYVDGPTVYELVRDGLMQEAHLRQGQEMAALARAAGLNIDYFPTNFVAQAGLLYYVDYECNAFMEEWSFERWGVQYWSRTPAFEEQVKRLG